MKKLICMILSLVLALSMTCAFAAPPTLMDGDFTLQTVNGDQVKLSDYAGKVVFINFFATWCGPCVYEMPALNDLAAYYADAEDVVILCVNCGDDVGTVSRFVQSYGLNALTFLCDTTTEVSYRYQVDAIPLTLIYDRKCNLYGTYVGVSLDVSEICAHYTGIIEGLR